MSSKVIPLEKYVTGNMNALLNRLSAKVTGVWNDFKYILHKYIDRFMQNTVWIQVFLHTGVLHSWRINFQFYPTIETIFLL